MMLNIKPQINSLLKEIPDVKVSFFYPEDWSKIPHITYYEASNSEYDSWDGVEAHSQIEIQIDIWDKKSTSELALAVDGKMSSIGFRRVFSGDLQDPSGLKHKTMRYRGIVSKNNVVYQD